MVKILPLFVKIVGMEKMWDLVLLKNQIRKQKHVPLTHREGRVFVFVQN